MSQEDIYLQSYPFTTAAAIIGFVDRKVSAILIGGRTILGVLRTFDQFGNLVIHDGIERIYFPETKKYAESSHPQIYVIRGENLLMMGDLDIDVEDSAVEGWEKIENYADACKLRRQQMLEEKERLVTDNNKMIETHPVVASSFFSNSGLMSHT